MAGDDIDPFQIRGNLSVQAHPTDPSEFGDGSVDIDGNINMNGTLGENTLSNGINIKDIKYLTIKEQSSPSNPSASENRFFIDSVDSLLKSKDSSGVVTIYQPLTSKGDLLSHDGSTQIRLPIGTDNLILSADSSEPSGLKWIVNTGGTGGGETNTASNIGTAGVGVYKQKVAENLEFKKINAGSSKVTITDDTGNDEIDIDIVEGNIIHQNLSGAGTNTHAQIDSHISSTSNPHSVTIDQVTPTTTKGDLLVEDGTNVIRLPVGTNNYVLQANSATSSGLEWTAFDHGDMDGLNDDDHSQYLLLQGRSGGQVAIGGIDASDTLTLQSTSNATKGQVIISETTGSTSTTTGALRIDGGVGIAENTYIGGTLGVDTIIENTLNNGVDVEGTVLKDSYMIKDEIAEPGNPVATEHNFYMDTSDSLFKSKDSSGVVTTYQPTNTKGDLVTHNGTTQVRLPVSTDEFVLTCDSTDPNGVIWKNLTPAVVGADVDPNVNNYLDIYQSTPLTLTSSYQDVEFQSQRTVSGNFTHELTNPSIITFNLTANFYIFLKMTTDVIVDNGDETLCTFRIVKDTGGGYVELPGSLGFIFNENEDKVACQTSSLTRLHNFSLGDSIKIQLKKDASSGANIETLINNVELLIIYFNIDEVNDNSQYFSVYNSSSTNLTGSFSAITLDTTDILDTIYTYTSNELTFTEGGIYFISANISSNNSSNTDSVSEFALFNNTGGGYNIIPGTNLYLHNHRQPHGSSTNSLTYVYTASINDKLQIHGRELVGNNISSIINGCNLNIIKLQSTLGQNTVNYLHLYDSSGGTIISSTFTDIPFDTEVIEDSDYTHTGSSPEFTINTDGRYIFFIKLNYDLSSNNNDALIKSRIVANTGAGYFDIFATDACSFHLSNSVGENSTNITCTLQLSENTLIKLQAAHIEGNTNTVALANSSITILKAEELSLNDTGLLIFGTQVKYVESLNTTTTTSTSYIQKLLLTTDFIPSGIYRIDFYYIFTIDNNNKKMNVRVLVNNVDTIHETTESIHESGLEESRHGFAHVPLNLGVNTVSLDFRLADTSSQISLSNAKMSMWRIS